MGDPKAGAREESFEGMLIAGKYKVGRLIGSGGMGTVWEGRHTGLGTQVAIKFIRRVYAERPDARRRFEIEARAAASVKSKHAAEVYDCGLTEEDLPYIVMEYLEGEALSEALVRRGPFEAQEVARLVRQASRALERAHDAGIVHRDLKPDNIFLATNAERGKDEPYVVKLVDFGIAKMLDAAPEAGAMGGPTLDGAVIGTPNFMSPEQLTIGGDPTRLTDLWALGACAYTAFTGRLAFEGDVLGDIVLKVCATPLPAPSRTNPKIPAGVDAWFERACNRDPKKRFQTADELATALEKVCDPEARADARSEDRVEYRMVPASPEALRELEQLQAPTAMSSRTALLAGLVIGVSLVVGLLGAFAYRAKLADEQREIAPGASADAGQPRR